METKKAIQFLVKFLVSYLLLSLIYQFFLWLYMPSADKITSFTAHVFCQVFNQFNTLNTHVDGGIIITFGSRKLINIKESCNAVSIINTLLSFIIAYKGNLKQYLIFIPISFVIIFISNITRLYFLIDLKKNRSEFFDLFHVYIFPAIIYLIAFLLMVLWVKIINKTYNGKQ